MHVNRRKNTISEKALVFFIGVLPGQKSKEKKPPLENICDAFVFEMIAETEIEPNKWNLWTGHKSLQSSLNTLYKMSRMRDAKKIYWNGESQIQIKTLRRKISAK